MPMTPDEYARDNGFSDAKSMRDYTEEFGTIELPPHEDTVVLSCEGYNELLRLTTPQPIETAPIDGTVIDLFYQSRRVADAFWFNGTWQVEIWGVSYRVTSIEEPTHWQPLPNTPPMPKTSAINQLSDDAQDALGE